MTDTDAEFLKQRRRLDNREFLIRALDPANAPRMAFTLRAMRELLSDGQWHSWPSVMAAGLRATDMKTNSVSNQLYAALSAGLIERRGAYSSRRGRRGEPAHVSDTRELRLIDWPDSIGEADEFRDGVAGPVRLPHGQTAWRGWQDKMPEAEQ